MTYSLKYRIWGFVILAMFTLHLFRNFIFKGNKITRFKNWTTIKDTQINKVRKDNKILLAVGVLSKLSMIKRREGIRITWFKECEANRLLVRCYFFTDELKDLSATDRQIYQKEDEENEDILYMPIKGGHNFALRLIWMLKWFSKKFDFQYFLRVDDDYFLCMNRLLLELPHRPNNGMYWGYTHCSTDYVVRVDEGWMILSRDIIEEALKKHNTTLLCHHFGDQAVRLWIDDSKLKITWFSDNQRIIHSATSYNSKKYMEPDICQKYIALHGTYTIEMLKYWIHYASNKLEPRKQYAIPKIPKLTNVCKKNLTFTVNAFYPHVRFNPKPCKDNPVWEISNKMFVGREEYGKEMVY